MPISLILIKPLAEGVDLVLHGLKLYATSAISDQAVADIISELPAANIFSLKAAKSKELEADCRVALAGGFTHDDCLYKSDLEAQSDYIGLSDMSKTTLESYPIRCAVNGVQQNKMHTPLEIKAVMGAGVVHKYTQLGKLGALEVALANATTAEAIAALVW